MLFSEIQLYLSDEQSVKLISDEISHRFPIFDDSEQNDRLFSEKLISLI